MPDTLTFSAIAATLGLTRDTVRRHLRDEPGVIVLEGKRKTYRVPRAVYEAWVERRTVKAKPEAVRFPRIVRPLRWG